MTLKGLKRGTILTIALVLLLTLSTMQVTYSAFFSVKSASNTQTFTTGELKVSIADESAKVEALELFPVDKSILPTEENSNLNGDNNNMYATLNLTNDGTVDADFMVTISNDNLPVGRREDERVDFKYLQIGIYDVTNNEWVSFSDETSVFYTTISGLTPTSLAPNNNVYPILRNTIKSGENKKYKIYIWLSEDTPTTEIGKLVYLKLEVKSTAVQGIKDADANKDPSRVTS